MYISEVSGHHSATLALEKTLKIIKPNVEIININAFNYTNPISEKIVNRIYMGVIKRTPGIWDYLYDNPRIVKSVERIKRSIHKLNSPKLRNLFDKFKPDAVLCSQAFPCGMVADYKEAYDSDIPLIAVLTDYVPHSYWIYDRVNYYIAPSEEVALRLVRKGISAEKIKILGIPFDPEFNKQIDKEAVLKKLGLKSGIFTVLIMGGGQGLGPIKTIVRSLEKVKIEIQEIVVTGSNQKLHKSLKKKQKRLKKRMVVFGYANNINELMRISDAIITKPGGITTAEALSMNLPMIIVKPIPGQEVSNTSYLTEKGAAIKVNNPKEVRYVVEDLLCHEEKIRRLKDSAACISKPNASFDISRLILDLCFQYKNKASL